MKKVLKQVLGVDVAQKELVVTLGRLMDDLSVDLYAHKVFKNSETGMGLLVEWVKKLSEDSVVVQYVMEATGIYHQKFAYYLADHCYSVSIVLPNKISNYMRTLEVRTLRIKPVLKPLQDLAFAGSWIIGKSPKRHLEPYSN